MQMSYNSQKTEISSIIDTGSIIVHYQPGESLELIVVSFYHITRSRAVWGGSFFAKNGISVLGITDYRQAWYPKGDMSKVLPVIMPILRRYNRVVTYGHSMGGYAAMKYGRELDADLALAFSPQHSIDPEDVWRFDNERATKHYRERNHKGMRVRDDDLPKRTLVFLDWRFTVDRRHAARLPKVDSVRFVACPFSGHETIEMLAQSRATTTMFRLVGSGDDNWQSMRGLVRSARRNSELYAERRQNYMKRRRARSITKQRKRLKRVSYIAAAITVGLLMAAATLYSYLAFE